VTAAGSVKQSSEGAIAIETFVTVVVFWLAHVYSAVLERRYAAKRFRLAVVTAVMVHELPIVEAGVPTLLLLVLGSVGILPAGQSIWLAVFVGAAQLPVWGWVGARRLGWNQSAVILAATLDALLGVSIIGLKVITH
jgi:hypothetical protein